MIHKKQVHTKFVPECEKNSIGKCPRGPLECWFVHKDVEKVMSSESVFLENRKERLPPDTLLKVIGLIEKLDLKMSTILESKTRQ